MHPHAGCCQRRGQPRPQLSAAFRDVSLQFFAPPPKVVQSQSVLPWQQAQQGSHSASPSNSHLHCSSPSPFSPLFLSVNGRQLVSDATLKLTVPGRREEGPFFLGDMSPCPPESFFPLHGSHSLSEEGWKELEGAGPPGGVWNAAGASDLCCCWRGSSLKAEESGCGLWQAPLDSGGVRGRDGGQAVRRALPTPSPPSLFVYTFPVGPCLLSLACFLLSFLVFRFSAHLLYQGPKPRTTGQAERRVAPRR